MLPETTGTAEHAEVTRSTASPNQTRRVTGAVGLASLGVAAIGGGLLVANQSFGVLSLLAVATASLAACVFSAPILFLAILVLWAPLEQALSSAFSVFQSGLVAQGGLALTLITAMALALRGRDRSVFHLLLPTVIFVFIYSLLSLCSSSINDVVFYEALDSLLPEIRYIFLFIGLSLFPAKSGELRVISTITILVVVVFCLLGWIHVFVGPGLYGFSEPTSALMNEDVVRSNPFAPIGLSRFKSPIGGHAVASIYFSAALSVMPLSAHVARRYGTMAVTLLTIGSVAAMASRYGFVAMGIGAVVSRAVVGSLTGILRPIAGGILVATIALALRPYMGEGGWADNLIFARLLDPFSTDFIAQEGEVGRVAYYQAAFRLTTSSIGTALFGLGPANWGTGLIQLDSDEATSRLEPLILPLGYWLTRGQMLDSNWASLLGQVGFPGTLAYFGIFVSVGSLLWSLSRRVTSNYAKQACATGLAVLTIYFLGGAINAMYINRLMSFTVWLYAGIAVRTAVFDLRNQSSPN